MLKFFFGRSSWMVYALNLVSLGGILALLVRAPSGGLGWVTYFLIFTWVFFNALNWIPWYPGTKGKLGIRLHLQKNIVPMAYLLPIALALKLGGASEWAVLPFALLFLPMYYVAFILLYFHFRDTSDLMPGYFTHNFYLQDEEDPCTHSQS